MATNSDDALQRQRDEIALLEAMYPEDQFESEASGTELTVRICLGATDLPVELLVRLPEGYPGTRSPELAVSCPQSSRQVQEHLHVEIQRIVGEMSGRDDEILDEVLNQFKAFLAEVKPDETHAKSAPLQVAASSVSNDDGTALVIVLWFHHLLATSKRSDIVALSSTHRLSGVSKPGYPGCLIVEGCPGDVRAYVAELRSWRWQGFQVRAEHVLPGGRLMSRAWDGGEDRESGSGWKGVVEVEKMADVVKLVQPFRLDELFLRAMKLGS